MNPSGARRLTLVERFDVTRVLVPAATLYVASWVIGLAIGSSSVGSGASDIAAQAHFTSRPDVLAAQATLVHGAAGLALLALCVGIGPLLSGRSARVVALGSGAAAALLSVTQALVAYVAIAQAPDRPGAWSRLMLETIAKLDVLKILLLAVFVGVVSTAVRAPGLARPVRFGGFAASGILVLGAASFSTEGSGLQAALPVSLLMLLAWVGSIGWLAGRGRPPFSRLAGPPW